MTEKSQKVGAKSIGAPGQCLVNSNQKFPRNLHRKITTFSIAVFVVVLISSAQLMCVSAVWWDDSWHYSFNVTVNSTTQDRNEIPVNLNVNFTQYLENTSGRFDENSIRVIEYDAGWNVIGERESDFLKTSGFDEADNAAGEIVFIANGTTTAGTIRYFGVYFDILENGPKAVPHYTFSNGEGLGGQYKEGTTILSNQIDEVINISYQVNSSLDYNAHEITWKGWLNSTGGKFNFSLEHTGCARLTIDNDNIIDNGSCVSDTSTEPSASKYLTPGLHKIGVYEKVYKAFQTFTVASKLRWNATGTRQIIPQQNLYGDLWMYPSYLQVSSSTSLYSVVINIPQKDSSYNRGDNLNISINITSANATTQVINCSLLDPSNNTKFSTNLINSTSNLLGEWHSNYTFNIDDSTGMWTIVCNATDINNYNTLALSSFYLWSFKPAVGDVTYENVSGWGVEHIFSANVTDLDSNVTVILSLRDTEGNWTNYTKYGRGVINWSANFTCADIGNHSFKFYYNDSDQTVDNTGVYNFSLMPDNVSLSMVSYLTVANRSQNTTITFRINDTDNNSYGTISGFLIIENSTFNNTYQCNSSPSNGNCEITFNLNTFYSPGIYSFYYGTNDSCYGAVNSSVYNFSLFGMYNISIDNPAYGDFLYKNQNYNFNSTILDEDGNIVHPDINWTIKSQFLNNSENFHWKVPLNFTLGPALVEVKNEPVQFYYNVSDTKSVSIYGYSKVELLSPLVNRTYNGTPIEIKGWVSDINSSPIVNYPILFYVDGVIEGVTGIVTGSDGTASVAYTPTKPGVYTFTCKISNYTSESEYLYYNTNNSLNNDSKTITISSNLNITDITTNKFFVDINREISANATISGYSDFISSVWVNFSGNNETVVKDLTNYTVIGDTRIYNTTFSPSKSGFYNITVFMNDTGGSVISSLSQDAFFSVDKTNASIAPNIDEINITLDETGNLTIPFNNTGNGTMYNASINPALPDPFIINPKNYSLGDIIPGSYNGSFNIGVNKSKPIDTNFYVLNFTINWTNPDGSKGSQMTNLSANIILPPTLVLDKNEININVSHNISGIIGNFTILSIGNYTLTDVFCLNQGGNLSDIGVSFLPTNYLEMIPAGNNKTVNLSISVPPGKSPGPYATTIVAQASNDECSSYPDLCEDTLVLNINILEDASWYLPKNLTVWVKPGTGFFNVSIDNLGNIDFNITMGSIGNISIDTPNMAISKQSRGFISVEYNLLNNGSGMLTVKNLENNNITRVNITLLMNYPPDINNFSVLGPSAGMVFNISANVTDINGVDSVRAEIKKPDGSVITKDMEIMAGDIYSVIYTADIEGFYNLTIYANDTEGLTSNVVSNFTKINTPPVITSVSVNPDHLSNGSVLISANVQDYNGVDEVWANITDPAGNKTILVLGNIGGDDYEESYEPDILGTYTFVVFANDTTGLESNSSQFSFIKQVNIDMILTGINQTLLNYSLILGDLNTSFNNNTQLLRNVSTAIESMNETISNLNMTKIQNATEELNHVLNSINFSLLEDISEISAQLDEINNTLDNITLILNQFSEDFNYSEEFENITNQLDDYRNNLTYINELLNEYNTTLNQINSSVGGMNESLVEKLINITDQLNNQSNVLDNITTNLLKQNSSLEKLLNISYNQTNVLNNISNKLSELNISLSELQNLSLDQFEGISNITKELVNITKDLSNKTEILANITSALSEQNKSLEQILDTSNNHTNILHNMNDTLQNYWVVLNSLNDTTAEQKEIISQLNLTISDINSTLQNYSKSLENLTNFTDHYSGVMDGMNDLINSTYQSLENISGDIAVVKDILGDIVTGMSRSWKITPTDDQVINLYNGTTTVKITIDNTGSENITFLIKITDISDNVGQIFYLNGAPVVSYINYTEIAPDTSHSYDVDINTVGVPDGIYKLKVYILNDTSYCLDTKLPDEEVEVIVNSTAPPESYLHHINVSAHPVKAGDNEEVVVNVEDPSAVEGVWIEMQTPNNMIITYDINTSQDPWTYIVDTTGFATGSYHIMAYANGSSGNISNSSYFNIVDNFVEFSGISSQHTEFSFYDASTGAGTYTFTSDGIYNESVPALAQDISVLSLGHTILFLNVSVNDTVSNPVDMKQISKASLNIPMAGKKIIGVFVNLSKNFRDNINDGFKLTVNYGTGEWSGWEEERFRLFICSNYTYNSSGNGDCSSGWITTNDSFFNYNNIDTSQNTIKELFDKSEFSKFSNNFAFAVARAILPGDGSCESGESYPTEPACGAKTTSISSGGGGGASPSFISTNFEELKTKITNLTKSVNETKSELKNLSKDVEDIKGLTNKTQESMSGYTNFSNALSQVPLTVVPNIIDTELSSGTNRTFEISLFNNALAPRNVSISISSNIKPFVDVTDSVIIEQRSLKSVKIKIEAQPEAEVGNYYGNIRFDMDGAIKEVPVTIKISEKQEPLLEGAIKILTSDVPSEGTLRFRTNLKNIGLKKPTNVTLRFILKDSDTGEVIGMIKEEKTTIKDIGSIESSVSLKDINQTLAYGNEYAIDLEANYGNKSKVIGTATFSVNEPFWTFSRILLALAVIIIAGLLFAGKHIRNWYIARRMARLKYVPIKDFSKLPTGKVWLGKIAETDKKAEFESDDLMTHMIVAGATGSGKTVTAMGIIESILLENIPVVIFDPTAQWTGFLRPNRDEKMFKHYQKFNMKIEEARAFKGAIYEITSLERAKLDLRKYMNPGEVSVFTLNKIPKEDYGKAVQTIINYLFTIPWEESSKLKMVVVFDEVHRLLKAAGNMGEDVESGYKSLEKACREFRKWGIGLIMVSQVLSDFKEEVRGNILTEIQMHTKSLADIGRVADKYGAEYGTRVAKMNIGTGLIQNPKFNDGKPWFVEFKPLLSSPHKLAESEISDYNKFNVLLDDLDSEIQDLKGKGVDVFDLELETKLARDKLKEAKFRMIEIYIDSIRNSINKKRKTL